MARYPIKQPPDGYMVHFDPQTKRYTPLERKMSTTGEYWEPFHWSDGTNTSYAKRADAVRFCERQALQKQKGEASGQH